ncbi:coatomer subunit delta [Rhizina undulata]
MLTNSHQVVLAASIYIRGGKPVISRQFREPPRVLKASSRIEGFLAAFPKLTDTGTQHTTNETDSDELYMVLITNRQSNILQDIDTLHLFAQLVSLICKSLDEREIIRNSFELLSAFDEIVGLEYRENLSLQQIKTFLEMESHEERIQEIIARKKEFEASEERKRKAKQLDLQRKEMSRNASAMGSTGRSTARASQFPTYNPPSSTPPTMLTKPRRRSRRFHPSLKESACSSVANPRQRKYLRKFVENWAGMPKNAPLVGTPAADSATSPARSSFAADRNAVQVTVSEQITAELTREGALKSFEVKRDLQLRISDPSLTKVSLNVSTASDGKIQFRTHPNVDKALFTSQSIIQLKDPSKGFPINNQIGVLRWRTTTGESPLSFTIWLNQGPRNGKYTVTAEYEFNAAGGEDDLLKDVVVSIPFRRDEPVVASIDEVYEVAGDCIDWNIPTVGEENSSGSFEFEAEAELEEEFFPMRVAFRKEKPMVDIEVNDVTLIDLGENVDFTKDVNSVADNYVIV